MIWMPRARLPIFLLSRHLPQLAQLAMFRTPLTRLRSLLPTRRGGRRDGITVKQELDAATLASSLSAMDLTPLRDVSPATLLGENSSILDPEVLHMVRGSSLSRVAIPRSS